MSMIQMMRQSRHDIEFIDRGLEIILTRWCWGNWGRYVKPMLVEIRLRLNFVRSSIEHIEALLYARHYRQVERDDGWVRVEGV